MNSNQGSSQGQESSSRNILEKVCEQIEQQIQSLLGNLNMESASQINGRLLEKCITSTKVAIMRVLSGRLPQIVAIEEKCKMLVVEINQELEMQKLKSKEIFSKYEYQVLQCDRYKMETVQVSQLYSSIYKQNIELRNQIDKLNRETEEDAGKLELEQKVQETKMYQQELGRNQELISELRRNEEVSNQRILHLLEEDKNKQEIIEESQLTIQMLKKQASDLVIEIEELKYKLDQNTQTHQQQINQIRHHYETTLNLSKQANAALNANLNECKETIKTLQLQHSELTHKSRDLQQQIQNRDERINQQSKESIEQKQKIHELQGRVGKIKDISRYQQKLQNKYSKKMELLSKQNSELWQKVKFLKSQNQRLYQAMDQYANKQLKLSNSLNSAQAKVQKYKQKQQGMANLKGRIRQFCLRTKKETLALRKYITGELQTNVKYVIAQYLQQYKAMRQDYELKLVRKLSEFSKERQNERQNLLTQIRNSEHQYRLLQQKSLESEINSSKVANALVDSKNKVYNQIAQKDKIIRALEKQLEQEKDINGKSNRKLAYLLNKYSNFAPIEKQPNFTNFQQRSSEELNLDKRLAEQKQKLLNLQGQFEAFMRN